MIGATTTGGAAGTADGGCCGAIAGVFGVVGTVVVGNGVVGTVVGGCGAVVVVGDAVIVGCVEAETAVVEEAAAGADAAVVSVGDARGADVGLGEFAPAIPATMNRARTAPPVIHGHFRRFFRGCRSDGRPDVGIGPHCGSGGGPLVGPCGGDVMSTPLTV
jgi:hypothetical protein